MIILSYQGDECEIDTFLMSCRVIGRTVETAMLDAAIKIARERGAERITGWVFLTKKNIPARDFYHKNGFSLQAEKKGERRWVLDLSESKVECPQWITLVKHEEEIMK
ncbi:MAG: GNAT family N-acetyltransferase [Proteobacteria bacterium]|nr:GNAT family N-acetyltransferase [Pseudomonadota bacterium]